MTAERAPVEVLKVSATSKPVAVAGAIAGVIRSKGRVEVQAIGAGGDEIVHNERLVLLAPDGTVNDVIEGSSWTPADLAAQLRELAGASSSPLARFDLALGAALAFCGGALSGRAGIGDLIASLLVLGALGAAFAWVVRRTSATNA